MKACKGLGGASSLKKSTMTRGTTYLSWRTIIDGENMMKRSCLIGGVLGHPVSIDVKGGENVGRVIILPSRKKGEIVGQGCHCCQYGINLYANILEMPGSR